MWIDLDSLATTEKNAKILRFSFATFQIESPNLFLLTKNFHFVIIQKKITQLWDIFFLQSLCPKDILTK